VEFVEDFHRKVADASSILVVGAGPTGLEVAGELAEKNKDKKIGLYTRGDKLLSRFGETANDLIKKSVEKAGVSLHTGDGNFDDNSILAKGYDYVIKCVGSKRNSEFLKGALSKFTDENGRIKVNQYYQLTTKSPMEVILTDSEYYNKESKGVKSSVKNDTTIESIFSLGDACISLQGEEKNIPSL